MDNLLYYPYINLPDSDWSIRTLLYYDRIGSIVPGDKEQGKKLLNPFMQQLLVSNLVEQIDPLQVLDQSWELAEAFIRYVDSKEFNVKKRREAFSKPYEIFPQASKSRLGSQHPISNVVRIHCEKFEIGLFHFLVENKLAKRLPKSEWFYVEKKTADELMTYLACVIGIKLNYLPTTDKIKRRYFRTVGLPKKDYQIYKDQKGKREIILENLIPVPKEIKINKIMAFKTKHHDLLKAFKNKVEQISLDPSINEDSELFEKKLDELILQKDELSTRMNESQLGNYFVGFSGVATAVTGLATETVAGQALAVLGLAGAIVSGAKIQKPEHVFDQSGLKYIALADKRLR